MQPANPISNAPPITKPAGKAGAPTISTSTATAPQIVEENIAAFKFKVGQQLQASIQAQISPGLYRVQIAGQNMQMQLPGLIRVGSTITLQVVSASPKPTFSVLSPDTPLSTAEEISSTSRLLSNLTQQPLSKTFVEPASGKAVWPSLNAAPETGKLAAALKDALANSGLFYESHQAQWVAGTRSTAQLLVEPQNLLAPMAKSAQPPPETGPAAVRPGAVSTATIKPDAHAVALAQSSQGIADTQTKGTTTDAISNAPFPIAKEIIPLVQQQLHTLETHQLAWSGQVWPNQQMQWEIQGEPEHTGRQSEERQWKTEMQLSLPRLGDVHASLIFHQGSVRLALHAADTNAAALFERRLPELSRAMKNTGILLSSAAVEKS